MGIYMHMWRWLYKLREKRCIKHCKKKYPDYVDDEYNLRNLKFIWGVRSAGTLHDSGANFNTVNDMGIIYDRDTKLYRMSVETIYIFPDRKTDCKYLRDCLKSFTQYMDDNGLDKNKEYALSETTYI